MDHPNIAKVLDAGVSQHGRPFFVMELVNGQSVTKFCEECGIGIRQRLLLFQDVCAAINHAHQKGIIHRDIKPSNVIVTETESGPVAKVIDFGIAKAIQGQLTDRTIQTRAEQWIGTPVYMSPEQAGYGGSDIDTRSDIYGLGVLLYELLTGKAPFDADTLMKAGYEEMRRIIREVDPQKPSSRLTHTAKGRSDMNRECQRAEKPVSSELDWIVMKAMEKSKERRYDSAGALSNDVGRYLSDHPIEAKPPATHYLISKFIKRNRIAITIAGAFLILIVSSTIISLWLASRAMDAEKIAKERLATALRDRQEKNLALEQAEAVSNLLADVFQRPQPGIDGRSVTVVQALDATVMKLDAQLAAQPERRIALREILAETYERLGVYERSYAIRKENFELHQEHSGEEHVLTRQSLRKLVKSAESKGDSAAALEFSKQEFEINKRIGANPVATLNSLRSQVRGLFGIGQREQAIEKQKELVDFCLKAFGPESARLVKAQWELRQYQARSARGDDTGSEDMHLKRTEDLESRLADLTEAHGSTHPDTIMARLDLAQSLAAGSHKIEALLHLRSLQPFLMENYGPHDERTIRAQSLLVRVQVGLGALREATQMQQAIVQAMRERDGDTAKSTIREENNLERRLYYSGPRDEYKRYVMDLLERRTRLLGEHDAQTAIAHIWLASQGVGKEQEAIQKAIQVISNKYGPNSRTAAEAIASLARHLTVQGETRKAMPFFEECGPNMRDDTWLNFELATFQLWMNDIEGYRNTRRYMLEYWENRIGIQKSQAEMFERAIWLCCLADLEDDNQKKSISRIMDHVKSMRESIHMEGNDRHTPTMRNQIHGIAWYRLGHHSKALECLHEVVRVKSLKTYKGAGLDYQLSLPMIHSYIAMAEFRLGNAEEAKRMLAHGQSLLKGKAPSEENPQVKVFVGGLALVHWISIREASNLLHRE